MITLEQLSKMIPRNKNPELWLDSLNEILPKYDINTPERIASFISQCAHESVDFTHTHENLNYSAKALRSVFHKYFTRTSADKYARKREAIANRVYANRMGNGDELSGDGYRYSGHGILQITGKNNHLAYSRNAYNDDRVLDNPKLLEAPTDAINSACWYWKINSLNVFADKEDVRGVTRRINGGYNGLRDREKRYALAIGILRA